MGRRGQKLEFPLADMLMCKCPGRVTAVKDHQLITPWKPETGTNIVEEGGRVAVAVVGELAAGTKISLWELVRPWAFEFLHSRCQLELLRLLPCVRMSSIVDDCKVIRTVIFVTEVGKPLMQSCLPTIGGYLVVLGLEVELV